MGVPIVWSLWWVVLGGTLPYIQILPSIFWQILGTGFVLSEILLLIIGIFACRSKPHRRLIPWLPSLMLYWPLATLAMYKAIFELLFAPFYWDKTEHGIT